jgi:ABC-type phosphate/phosphonate transport system substrate-binding protein
LGRFPEGILNPFFEGKNTMKKSILAARCWLVLGLSLAGVACAAGTLLGGDPEVINIGIVESLVRDISPGRKKFLETEFSQMVQDFTGLKSKIFQGGDALEATKKMEQGQWHMTVMQGIEFAWAQSRDPKLQPLMVAVYKQKTTRAQLVTKKDSAVKGFADLKGKAVLVLTKEHSRLFADKETQGNAKDFFGKVVTESNVETALDAVLLDKVVAAVVDTNGMETYKEIFPGRYNRLKVIAESDPFPAGVIVYRQGMLGEKILNSFRTGMLKANQSSQGRETMAMFRITAFEPVPSDYAQIVSSILKAYPAPK